jgi:hypothetical protein
MEKTKFGANGTELLPLGAVGEFEFQDDRRIALLNHRINLGKCEHPCQVRDMNPGGQVPPQGTQPAELSLVCP